MGVPAPCLSPAPYCCAAPQVDVSVEPTWCVRRLRTLPRVGLCLQLPRQFDRMLWLGRGPHECYPDRKSSAFMGVWYSTVAEQHVPYIYPSEVPSVCALQGFGMWTVAWGVGKSDCRKGSPKPRV